MRDSWDDVGDRAAVRALLRGLLVGERRLMASVGDWAERLAGDGDSPLAGRFIEQLDDEWFDAEPPDALAESITEQVRTRLSAWHPGWPHLWGHILRVTGTAVALAEDEREDPLLAYLAGTIHDVAKLDELRTGEPHEEQGAVFAARALRGALRPSQIDAIQAAILKEGDDALTDLLNDADKLDKIGAAGLVRRASAGARWSWLREALWRVEDDAARFPGMHFDRSRDLATGKRAFLAWFLPLADPVVDGE